MPDKRSPDQDTAIEEAFVAGTLPEEDRRVPGAEVKLPGLPEDAGASLQVDNATTPSVKANQHSDPTVGASSNG